jgi:hypothetical protein
MKDTEKLVICEFLSLYNFSVTYPQDSFSRSQEATVSGMKLFSPYLVSARNSIIKETSAFPVEDYLLQLIMESSQFIFFINL